MRQVEVLRGFSPIRLQHLPAYAKTRTGSGLVYYTHLHKGQPGLGTDWFEYLGVFLTRPLHQMISLGTKAGGKPGQAAALAGTYMGRSGGIDGPCWAAVPAGTQETSLRMDLIGDLRGLPYYTVPPDPQLQRASHGCEDWSWNACSKTGPSPLPTPMQRRTTYPEAHEIQGDCLL